MIVNQKKVDMKKGMFTLALAALFAACTKEDQIDLPKNNDSTLTLSAQAAGSFASAWQKGLEWQVSDSSDFRIYTHGLQVPALTQQLLSVGAVLVFVKNIPWEDGSRLARPMLTPFHVLPSISRPGYDQMWYNVNSVGKIMVKYRTNKQKYGTPQVPDGDVQVRYFIISDVELEDLGYTPATIARLNYTQLVNLLGASQ
jgi:hypothetical protein